ncbi:MAG: quinoprotein dehydrogenase-associated SoxYZ-like carrier [Gammaproteobacteria bacterium]|nr:quinoprotein dehydrogenase-associated SoxYZ-like carrier [Gammaproteobacteria bacterium]
MKTALFFLLACSALPTVQGAQENSADYADWGGAFTQPEGDRLWQGLALGFFGEREIIESDKQRVIRIEAPARAENDALVPVQIHTELPEGFSAAIQNIYLTVDINPSPMAAKFTVSPTRNPEYIATRVRVNGYTYIRAIAEMTDGTLYMDKQWVKSRGAGCSAPPGTNQEQAKASLGNMRFKFSQALESSQNQSKAVQLMISHPNNTGMQRDQLSTMLIPQSYVKEVEVSFNDERLLKAETSFTISENPSFRFKFAPDESGELVARMRDTDDKEFYLYQTIKADE